MTNMYLFHTDRQSLVQGQSQSMVSLGAAGVEPDYGCDTPDNRLKKLFVQDQLRQADAAAATRMAGTQVAVPNCD